MQEIVDAQVSIYTGSKLGKLETVVVGGIATLASTLAFMTPAFARPLETEVAVKNSPAHHDKPKLKDPTSLKFYSHSVDNNDFTPLKAANVGIYSRPRGSEGSYEPLCNGDIVSLQVSPNQPPQQDVLTAKHCFATLRKNIAGKDESVDIVNAEPNEYAIGMAQNPLAKAKVIGLVDGISVIRNSGERDARFPDAALLSVIPTPNNTNGADLFHDAIPLHLTPGKDPLEGEQVASFSIDFQFIERSFNIQAKERYLGSFYDSFEDPKNGEIYESEFDILGAMSTDAHINPNQFSTSGHLVRTASGSVLGPLSFGEGSLGIKDQPKIPNYSLKKRLEERKDLELDLKLKLDRYTEMVDHTVLSKRNIRQLIHGLGRFARLKSSIEKPTN